VEQPKKALVFYRNNIQLNSISVVNSKFKFLFQKLYLVKKGGKKGW